MLELSSAALGIAVISCIGRGLLAWLPPGEIGSHRTAELPATWSASYLLGCAFIGASASAACLAHLPISCAWIAAVGALVLLARWATLPGALVPRHEVRSEPGGLAACALLALSIFIGVFACASASIDAGSGSWAVRAQAWLSQGDLLGAGPSSSRGALDRTLLDSGAIAFVSWPGGAVSELAARAHLLVCTLAALLLAERALRIARRAPIGRRLVLALLALALAPAASAEDGDLLMAALCALALAGTESWTRRADRRGLALSCIGWSSLALVRPGGWPLACAGLAAIVASSARPSAKRALSWALACALVWMSLWPLAAWSRHVALLGAEPLASLSSSWALTDRARAGLFIAPIWIALGAALGPVILRGLRPPPTGTARAEEREPDRTRRDLAALLAFGAVSLLLAAAVIALSDGSKLLLARAWAPGLLVQAAPFAAVLAARSLVRAERTA